MTEKNSALSLSSLDSLSISLSDLETISSLEKFRSEAAKKPAAAPPPPPPPRPMPPANEPARVRMGLDFGPKIGEGGMGRILAAQDQGIQRNVAVKMLRKSKATNVREVNKLLREIQITGQLEHPNIVPIYSMGKFQDGQLFFTMKRLYGYSLKYVISKLRRGDKELLGKYNRLKMLRLFQEIARAIDYAHARGVVHRDIKPENVMVGDYGEALMVDWGLALVVPRICDSELGPVELTWDEETRDRVIVGTPAYLSPEQARGENSIVDRRTDVYGLGALLYEMLTYTPPVQAPDVYAAIDEVLQGEIDLPSRRSPHLDIPGELDEIVRKAMSYTQEGRYPTAQDMADDVHAFFEGTLAFERRRREADEKVTKGEQETAKYRNIAANREETAKKLQTLKSRSRKEDSGGLQKEIWLLEETLESVEQDEAERFNEAITFFLMALELEPHHSHAKARLAELYWEKYLAAEKERNRTQQLFWRGLVTKYDEGRFTPMLTGKGQLTVTFEPEKARVELFRYHENSRRLELKPVDYDLENLARGVSLDCGSYLVVISEPGYSVARYPVLIERDRGVAIHLKLKTREEVGDGFIWIPAGEQIIGGDPETFGCGDEERVQLPDYAIGRVPVTLREYVAYLNELAETDPEQAEARVPREYGSNIPYLPKEADGKYALPVMENEAERWEWNWPALGISFEDALAYTRWRSEKDGITYRLPTSAEWERAARGADRRRYPWGNRFDPSFANMRFTQERPRLRRVGTTPTDVSPYGVRDVAGNIRDWVDDVPPDGSEDQRTLRGGAWTMYEMFCRCCYRGSGKRDLCAVNIGFRLVKDL